MKTFICTVIGAMFLTAVTTGCNTDATDGPNTTTVPHTTNRPVDESTWDDDTTADPTLGDPAGTVGQDREDVYQQETPSGAFDQGTTPGGPADTSAADTAASPDVTEEPASELPETTEDDD